MFPFRARPIRLCTLLALLSAAGGTSFSPAGPAAPPAAESGQANPAASLHGDAASWRQWGGPNRNFVAPPVDLADAWPDDGPRHLWRRELGEGYSAIAADEGRLYTMYRREGLEVVVALEARTGETLWEFEYEASVRGLDTGEGSGPHASPLVVGERVFVAGVLGDFHALDKHTGEVLWSRQLWAQLGGTFRPRGYSSSPMAYENTVIAFVGGRGQAAVAFDQEDGSIVWRGGDFDNAQASPVVIDVDGQPQLVAFMVDFIAGLDPSSGQLLWRHPHRTDYGLNIATPVWGDDNILFFSSAYNGGSRALRLSLDNHATRVEELWATNQMRVHFGTAVRVGDFVFGSNGDFGPSFITAVNVHDGTVAWRDRAFAKASFVFADGRLVLLDEDGDIGLVTVTPEGMSIQGRAQVLDSRAWTPPTLAGTMLYIRNLDEIVALDLGVEANGGH